MNPVIFTGSAALDCINSELFQLKWKALYDRCPWAIACQHPDFVGPWYQLYQTLFLPVIVVKEAHDHSLEGLLTLALRRNGKKMTCAGERQAEYHGWIATLDTDSNFIQNAVQKIRATFRDVDLCFKYLPPGIPLDWISKNKNFGKFCALRSYSRPIMKIDEAAMARQRNKKNNRQNYNRLKKLGEVQFERVLEQDHFTQIFDEVCMQYDFRQGALYQDMPFSSDPSKKSFYLELHKRGLLHTTILTVDGEIAASHSGLVSNAHAVHLGINTHAPAFAAHSPGNLLLAMLGVHLAKEQMPLLDLTPGGDAYKENFATAHDSVFELTIYSNIKTRLKTEALKNLASFFKARLRMAGYRGADVTAALAKLKKFMTSGLPELVAKLRVVPTSRHCEYRYCQNSPPVIKSDLMISKNCLNDILRFDPLGSSVSCWEFLRTVMERMERSNNLYSFVREEKLLIFCWVRMSYPESTLQQPGQNPALSDNGIVVSDLYVHHRLANNDLVQLFIVQLVNELKKIVNRTIFYSGNLNTELQTVMNKCGFIAKSR